MAGDGAKARLRGQARGLERIVSEAISAPPGSIVEVSGPPGSGKTYTTLKAVVERGSSAVISFPNHANQMAALASLLDIWASEGYDEPTHYVVDYAGIERYCVFHDPEAAAALLSGGTPREMVDRAMARVAGKAAALGIYASEVEAALGEVARALSEYREGRITLEEYRSRVRRAVEAYGQSSFCRSACPIGIYAQWYAPELARSLRRPTVVTWRRLEMRLPRRLGRRVVEVRLREALESLDRLEAGEARPEWLLCPRLALTLPLAPGRGRRRTPIPSKRSIVLTPHSGLEFVLSLWGGRGGERVVVVDEYDSYMLRPESWKLVPLDLLKHLASVAEELASAGVGGEALGVEVDLPLYIFAELAYEALTALVEEVEESLERGVHSPLADVTVEGAFSTVVEDAVPSAAGAQLTPLSPRLAHRAHLSRSRAAELLANFEAEYARLAGRAVGGDWRVALRGAWSAWAEAVSRSGTLAARAPKVSDRELYASYREGPPVDALPRLISYARALRRWPAQVLYYTVSREGVFLSSLDARLSLLLGRSLMLISATPVRWDLFARGPSEGPGHPALDAYAAARTSIVSAERRGAAEYADLLEVSYTLLLPREAGGTARLEPVGARQLMPPGPVSGYRETIRIVYEPLLPPLGRRPTRGSLAPYASLISTLASRGERVLAIAQNKRVAAWLGSAFGGRPAYWERAADSLEQATHIDAGRVHVIWFRGRGSRGIDLPGEYDSVVVVGSPYARPDMVSPAPPSAPHALRLSVRFQARSWNTGEAYERYLVASPHSTQLAVNELFQALGRAARRRAGGVLRVYMPAFLRKTVLAYGPPWAPR